MMSQMKEPNPASPSTGGTSPKHRMGALDGLRAVAVIVIFFHHAFPDELPGGYYGVDIFFALSGYLITSQLLREQLKYGSVWMKGFYIRRALRLTPALLIVAAFASVTFYLFEYGASPLQSAISITYLMDFWMSIGHRPGGALSHTWSLAVEEQFYIVWPALLVLLIKRHWPILSVTIALIIISVIPTITIVALRGANSAYYSPFAHLGEIGAGVLLAILIHSGRTKYLQWTRIQLVPLTAAALLLLAILLADQGDLWQYYGGFLAAGLIAAFVICHCLYSPSSATSRILASPALTWIGERSYGIYLWHYPILYCLQPFVALWVASAIGMIATVAAAELSYRYVEKPFNVVKDKKYSTKNRPTIKVRRK
jgi:peptidoglycan/LPS O-acetylase OafA/YrhL